MFFFDWLFIWDNNVILNRLIGSFSKYGCTTWGKMKKVSLKLTNGKSEILNSRELLNKLSSFSCPLILLSCPLNSFVLAVNNW